MDISNLGPTLVLGGARSGKSTFAEKLVEATGSPMHYLATGRAFDEEMQERIALHQATRQGKGWTTHEEPLDLVGLLRRIDEPGRAVLIDCLTLWVTNLMMEERDMAAEFAALAAFLPEARSRLVFVSNEVGLGSSRKTGWRATFAITPAGSIRSWRRNPQKFTLSRPDCR